MKLIVLLLASLISHNLMATEVDKIDFEAYAKANAYNCHPILNQVVKDEITNVKDTDFVQVIFARTQLDAKISYLNLQATSLSSSKDKIRISAYLRGATLKDMPIDDVKCDPIK